MKRNNDLLDSFYNKIKEKIELNAKLRNQIINFTNNFREFKIIKTDITERLLDHENDLTYFYDIVTSLTNKNTIYKEALKAQDIKLENFQIKLDEIEQLKQGLEKVSEELNSRINIINASNKDKDAFINELLSKVNFFKNLVKSNKRINFVSYWDKAKKNKSPSKNEDLDEFSKSLNDKSVSGYSRGYDKNLFINSIKKPYDDNIFSSENTKKESICSLLKNMPESPNELFLENNNTHSVINKELKKSFNKSLYETNKFFYSNDLNKNINSNTISDFKTGYNTLNSFYSPHQIDTPDLKKSQIKLFETIKEDFEHKNSKEPFLSQSQLNYKPHYNNTSNVINNNFIDRTNALNEKVDIVGHLLIKILSSNSIAKILKRKYGENFEKKLVDKDSNIEFIRLIESEVQDLFQKEKERKSIIKERLAANKSKRSFKKVSSEKRSMSPKYTSDSENMQRKKIFNHHTKKNSSYFDPKLQQGGESSIPRKNQTNSLDNIKLSRENSNGKNNKNMNRLSTDPSSKIYNYREFPRGWNSLKEFFVSQGFN